MRPTLPGAALAIGPRSARAEAFLAGQDLLAGHYAKARAKYVAVEKSLPRGSVPFAVRFGVTFSHLYEGNVDAALDSVRTYLAEYKAGGLDQQFPEVFGMGTVDPMMLDMGVDPLVFTEQAMLDQAADATAGVAVRDVEVAGGALTARVASLKVNRPKLASSTSQLIKLEMPLSRPSRHPGGISRIQAGTISGSAKEAIASTAKAIQASLVGSWTPGARPPSARPRCTCSS